MIRVTIDVSKIDKNHLTVYNGKTYLTVLLWETPDNQYGNDYRCDQQQQKVEEGKPKPKKIILGNGKIIATKSNTSSGVKNIQNEEKEDLPF
jgi:hypothetical protein